jgi:hypothetical protein
MSNKEELSEYDQIIRNSFQKIARLKIIANFFDNSDLVSIVIRTKIIHNLFESNKNLDIHKLDLFHLQFTNSFTALFQKIKKSIEQQLHLIHDEMNINEQFIEQYSTSESNEDFKIASSIHSKQMSRKLEELYEIFSSDLNSPFEWTEILDFANEQSNEFYRDITKALFDSLTDSTDKRVYKNELATIETKLLGKLNIQKFRVRFQCGLKYQSNFVDVFKFLNTDDKFVYRYATNEFYLLEDQDQLGLDLSKNKSDKQQILHDLREKNALLQSKINSIKTTLQPEVLVVLKSYLDKISSVSFLEDLENVDEQTSILKAMLNVKIQ